MEFRISVRYYRARPGRFVRLQSRFIVTGAAALLLGVCFLQPPSRSQNGARTLSPVEKSAYFDKNVLPTLQASCIACHAGEEASGGLDLTSREGLMKGGFSGPALNLSDPAKSL